MPAAATDIISLARLKFAIEITEVGDLALDAQLESYIQRGIDRVSKEVGFPLLKRTVDVVLPPPVPDEKLRLDIPDFVEWAGYSYVPATSDVYSAPTTTADAWGKGSAGYPPTAARSLSHREGRVRRLVVWPNGLGSATATKLWPAMNPDSEFVLTASTEMPLPSGDLTATEVAAGVTKFEREYGGLAAAVELAARSLWNGDEEIRFRDAVVRFCRPYRQWYNPDAPDAF